METEARYEQIIKASKLVITVVFVVLFIMAYRWVLIFGTHYPQQGNVVLATLMGIAFLAALILFVRRGPTSKFYVWKSKWYVDRWMYLTTLILCTWHLAAGMYIDNREVQTVFLYAPISVLGITVTVSLIALFMYGAKEHKKGQL